MNGKAIHLQRTWYLGTRIAGGGFGQVYMAQDEDGSPAAIKLVLKVPGAARELLLEAVSNKPNIIPIWDSGEWDNYYVLVMPRAEKSLRQHLNEVGGKLTPQESVTILLDITEALVGLERDVVHRDLKPENILLYQGHWCLADFGIARYAEATTAPDTRKHSFTYPYAAPEQWNNERATPAADVYAFGAMAFELHQGHWPFPGPDFREQHLNQKPPTLVGCGPSIASLVTECLSKAPQARPTPANILMRLRKSQQPSSPAAAALQAAYQQVVDQQAEAGAMDSAQKSTAMRRGKLLEAAQLSFELIIDAFIEQIRDAAPLATITRSPNLAVQLGKGKLFIAPIQSAPPKCLAAFGHPPAFDVIGFTTIEVHQPPDRFQYEGRAHALWFCDAHDEGVYRWFEMAFMEMAIMPRTNKTLPFALAPTNEEAAAALSPVMATHQIAWQSVPFDQGNEEQFLERWLRLFAGAVGGTLHGPLQLPEDSGGRHRRANPNA